MLIIRKIKSAAGVLKKDGVREAFGLLGDNILKFTDRAGLIIFSKYFKKVLWLLDRCGFPRGKRLNILYVTSLYERNGGQTYRYRISNIRKALRQYKNQAVKTRFDILEYGIFKSPKAVAWADILVLMRLEWSPMLEKLVKTAKELKIPVVFDMDDIIFLPEYAEGYCKALGENHPDLIRYRIGQIENFHKTFINSDYLTASTPFIAAKAGEAGKKAYVLHNGLNQKQLGIASRIRQKDRDFKASTIGYLSGTKTHNQDFLQALPALKRILREYRDVDLHVIGYIDPGLFSELNGKVRITSYVRWTRLLKKSAGNFINIAPLELGNSFCHAKSELKYFEAAIIGVPTIASGTDTFLHCIENGVNGFIANNEEDWYRAFRALLDHSEVYNKIKKNAQIHAIKNYAPHATACEAVGVYEKILSDYKKQS